MLDQFPTRDRDGRINPANVEGGDRIALGLSVHGSLDLDAVEYSDEQYTSYVVGEVVDAPRTGDDYTRQCMSDGDAVLADITVEADSGDRFTWNVDNGYVLAQHPEMGRRTDVARISGVYDPDAL